jgi:Dolichyl-phosphate-mannose-protein mannosyltransferase
MVSGISAARLQLAVRRASWGRLLDLPAGGRGQRSTGALVLLNGLLLAGAAAYVTSFVAAGTARMSYPFPLEISEGAALETVRRILHGQAVYVQASVSYVPFIYGPLYFYVAALIATVAGPSFVALRLLSFLASVASVVVVCLLVWRETESLSAGVIGAGLLAATYPLADQIFDIGRVDALFLFLLLAGLLAARWADLRPRTAVRLSAISGCLVGLALLTKQAAIPAVFAMLVYSAIMGRRRLLPFASALALTTSLPLLLLVAQSGVWVELFLWELPRRHLIDQDRLARFWPDIVLPHFTVALALSPLFVLRRTLVGDHRTTLFYGAATVSLLAPAWLSHANQGAGNNVLPPVFALVAILFGLGMHQGLGSLSAAQAQAQITQPYLLAVALFQCLVLLYDPRSVVPNGSDFLADSRLATALSSFPGVVLAPDFVGYMRESRNPDQPFLGAAGELVGAYGGGPVPEASSWLNDVERALLERRYDYVVLDPDSFMYFIKGWVEGAGYVHVGPLFPPDDQFWAWRSGRTPKAEVYVPRERLTNQWSCSSCGAGVVPTEETALLEQQP